MLRRVVLEHVAPGLEVVAVHLFERDALRAGERVDVAADVQQIVVAGDRPEALAAVVLRPPAHRVGVAQPLERGVRDAADVGVGIGDVGIGAAEIDERLGHPTILVRPLNNYRSAPRRSPSVAGR